MLRIRTEQVLHSKSAGKHLVSLGVPHDGYMCLWDWKSGALLMKTRAAVTSLSATTLQFATDGSFFVSGGTKHLKHWTIGGPRARSSGMNTNPGMDGKPVKLGSQKDSSFVSVASTAAVSKEHASGVPAHQPLYALTSAGDVTFCNELLSSARLSTVHCQKRGEVMMFFLKLII